MNKLDIKNKIPIILKLAEKPEAEVRNKIRSHNLKWNAIRKEWSGLVENVQKLKEDLGKLKFELEVLER